MYERTEREGERRQVRRRRWSTRPTVECLEDRATPATFSFAGFTFEDTATPDVQALLNPGTYSGAVVTSVPTDAAGSVVFPDQPAVGFVNTNTLGNLLENTGTSRPLNLPDGNNGTTQRSGVTLGWSGGRGLPNLAGDDLVFYESGSNSVSPEAFMIQVFNATTGSWSQWYYEAAESFALFGGVGTEGGFATAFDLSDLGIGTGEVVTQIRLVNMTDEDRMANATGQGLVIPEDDGDTSSFFPNPGPLANFTNFGGGTLDPDPLFVGVLTNVVGPVDYGDAPDTSAGTGTGDYQTLAANGGPSHAIIATLRMGAAVDQEAPARQSANADGDDTFGGDDEDGLVDPATDLTLVAGIQPTVRVLVTNNTGNPATLYGWIDFNRDGVFDNGTERAQIAVPDGTTNQTVTLTFPAAPTGFTGLGTFARFRLSTDAAAANSTGAATDGEVEDYAASYPVNQDFNLTLSQPVVAGNEGFTFTNGGTYTDPDVNDDVVFTVTAGPGTVTKTGTNTGTWSWSFTPPDGFTGPVNVTITADDGNGHQQAVNFAFTVQNVAPTVAIDGPAVVDEGAATNFTFTVTDPGLDTIQNYVVRWGDGQSEVMAGSPHGTSLAHTYADEGDYTITIDVTDEDGTFVGAGTIDVAVVDVVNFLGTKTTTTTFLDPDDERVLVYAIEVTNQGPDAATNVTVDASLDVNLPRVPGTAKLFPDASASAFTLLDAAFGDIGLFRGGQWIQDSNGSGAYDAGDKGFLFGQNGDLPVLGDWNGSGVDDLGVFRGGLWILDTNGTNAYDAGDMAYQFGTTGDLPVVGDWNGDGVDDLGVFRNGLWILDRNGSRTYDAGDIAFFYGEGSDIPVVGDWNGDDVDQVGLFRNGTWYYDRNGSYAYDAGDDSTMFGTGGDRPIVGDWNGDGRDEVGVWRQGQWYYDTSGDGFYGAGDTNSAFGASTDTPVVGTWPNSMPLGEVQVGTLQPGQTARVEVRVVVAPGTPANAILPTDALVNGTDSGTGNPYGGSTNPSAVQVDQPVTQTNDPALLQATRQVLASAVGMELDRISFRNAGDLGAGAVQVILQVPAGVTLDAAASHPGWRVAGANTFRLAVGPLGGGQNGFADVVLKFDADNPPALPLALQVTIQPA